jgi:hypothetical protein
VLREVLAAGTPGRLLVLMRRAHLYREQRRVIGDLLSLVPDSVLISAAEPYDVTLFPKATSVYAIYGDGQVCIDALADALTGTFKPSGRLPVEVCREVAAE